MIGGFSLRGLLVAFGIVALVLPASFAGLFGVLTHVDQINARIASLRESQLDVAVLMRLQSDEENAVRAYAATGNPAYRAAYTGAVIEYPVHAAAVAAQLQQSKDVRARDALTDARLRNEHWRLDVGEPTFARHQPRITDRAARDELRAIRDDMEIVSAVLIGSYHRLIRERSGPVRLASLIGFAALVVVGLQILVYAFLVARLRGELQRERRLVSLLQAAFASEIVSDRRLDIAASYASATRGAKVGGDVYDIFPINEHQTLVAIADVSGKGVAAAVDSTLVKYSLRAFAFVQADAATMVTRFNRLYAASQRSAEAFVVLFAGIIDNRTATLTYVNAGHEPAYIRRLHDVEQLAPTGPIVGIAGELNYASMTTNLSAGDVLFLSTDGLTEARDPSGRFLTSAGLETWLREADASSAASLVDAVTRRLRRFTRHRSSDDLAVLAVRRNDDV